MLANITKTQKHNRLGKLGMAPCEDVEVQSGWCVSEKDNRMMKLDFS